jgi:hypothetical protein
MLHFPSATLIPHGIADWNCGDRCRECRGYHGLKQFLLTKATQPTLVEYELGIRRPPCGVVLRHFQHDLVAKQLCRLVPNFCEDLWQHLHPGDRLHYGFHVRILDQCIGDALNGRWFISDKWTARYAFLTMVGAVEKAL